MRRCDVNEAIQIVKLVADILLPLGVEMFKHAMNGGDPRDVIRDERVRDLLPEQSATERAMLAARKNGGA
jgi:hypothetical protein